MYRTYRVACCVLLLGADDVTTSLGGVECALALDDGLTLRSTAAGLASNPSDGVPVIHLERRFGGSCVGRNVN